MTQERGKNKNSRFVRRCCSIDMLYVFYNKKERSPGGVFLGMFWVSRLVNDNPTRSRSTFNTPFSKFSKFQ